MNWRFWEKLPARKIVRLVTEEVGRDEQGRFIKTFAEFDDNTRGPSVKLMISSPELAYFNQHKAKLP